jgi:hypothetical protein
MWMADPHVISALRAKRAELSGELIAAEKRILQLREDISSLDRTMRVFDPTRSRTRSDQYSGARNRRSFLAVSAAGPYSTCCDSPIAR